MAEPVRIESAVSEVEVFRSGALVTRTAFLDGSPWPDEVALDGLPLALDDESVRVSLSGEGPLPSLSDVRVALVLPPPGASLEPPGQQELRDAADAAGHLRARLARLDREDARLDRIQLRLAEPFANRPPRPAPAAAWRGVLTWIEGRKAARLEERLALEADLREADETLARLRRREAEARAARDAAGDAVSKRVVLRLRDPGPPARATLRLTYAVPGARWAPSYVLRMSRDGRSASLAIRALVSQRSGEPWRGVALTLSTADLHRETEIPELPSLRIGRAAPHAARRAWREPPPGLDDLFLGVDESLARRPSPPPPAAPEPQPEYGADESVTELTKTGSYAAPADAAYDEEPVSKKLKRAARSQPAKPATMMVPAPVAAPAPIPPPPMQAMAMRAPMETRMRTAAPGGRSMADAVGAAFGGMGARADLDLAEGAAPESAPPSPPPAPSYEPDAGSLRYGDLVMAAWDDESFTRGRLRPVSMAERLAGASASVAGAVARQLASARDLAAEASGIALPAGATPVEESAGSFDHRYTAEGPVNVPSDGRLHGVPLFARTSTVATALVVVPRESPLAVRIATLKNPLRVPLLAGPAEIYLEDEFLVSSPLRTVPAGAELSLGLGVEERLKVARHVTYAEETHGMLGGGTTLDHRVEVEVASRLASPAEVEVRERVPLKAEHDKEVEVIVSDVSPAWSDFDQPESVIKGGKRWRFTLAAGESRKLAFRYQIRIDGKNELVGGNRREA